MTGQEGAAPPRTTSISLGVVVERRASSNRWVSETWMPVAVVAGAPVGEPWRIMHSEDGMTRYLARVLELTLHRSEAEAYKVNLSEPVPHVYVVLTEADDGDIPYEATLVTCAPYEAEGYLVDDGAIVEPVPMPQDVLAMVEDFVEAHYKPVEFRKRRRDAPPAMEEQRFGKDPIFDPDARHQTPPGDDGTGEGEAR